MTGENVSHTLSPEAQQAVMRLQRTARAPIAAILLAAYSALLASHGAGPDLVIGLPVDVRGTNASAIGYHVNVVPLRVRVDFAEGFRALVRKARDTFLGAMAHARTSVDELTGELPGFSSSWQCASPGHLFNFLPEMAVGELSVDGMAARLLPVENPYSKFDLELVGTPAKAEILFRYSRETLARADVAAMLRRFDALLVAQAQDPDRPLGETAGWSAGDRETVDRANDTDRRPQAPTVPAAFGARAAATPQAAAVVEGESSVSYRELQDRAEAIRALLTGAGVGAGDVVAVAVSTRDVPAAALGVWLAGAVHLPLDPGHDPAWLTRQITHARGAAVLTGTGTVLPAGADLPPALSLETSGATCAGASAVPTGTGTVLLDGADLPVDTTAKPGDAVPGAAASGTAGPGEPVDPAAPACLIHSCGDDGQPVATVLSHAGIAERAAHFAAELGVEPGTGVLTLAAPATLGSILDVCLALSAGGRVVVAPEQARTGGAALREAVGRHDVAVEPVPPGTPARILEDAADRLPGLTVLAQGDELHRATAERLLAAGCWLHCAHGSAATTGWAVSGRAETADAVHRGRPVTRTRAFVTAPDGRELPAGLRGELRVAGAGLALDEPRPEAPAFPVDERYGRHHRTGHLARLSARWHSRTARPDGPPGRHPRRPGRSRRGRGGPARPRRGGRGSGPGRHAARRRPGDRRLRRDRRDRRRGGQHVRPAAAHARAALAAHAAPRQDRPPGRAARTPCMAAPTGTHWNGLPTRRSTRVPTRHRRRTTHSSATWSRCGGNCSTPPR